MGVSGNNGTCCVAQGEDCTACGVGCGSGGQGALAYVGHGQGEYVQETTYKYVGCGGDFDVVRPRRDFTCVICLGGSLLLLIPLLCWLLSGSSRQLDGRLVSAQEGLVLCKQGQRVSTGSRRLCMMV